MDTLTKLEILVLSGNQIGDAGVISLSGALAMGALRCISSIHLEGNHVRALGKEAMHDVGWPATVL